MEGCATAAASAAVFGGAFVAGFGASTGAAAPLASTDATAGEGIGVPSGLSETVLTGFGSGNCDNAGGGDAGWATTTGASAVAMTGGSGRSGAGRVGAAWAPVNGAGEASAFRSTGCSSEATTLT